MHTYNLYKHASNISLAYFHKYMNIHTYMHTMADIVRVTTTLGFVISVTGSIDPDHSS